MKKTTLTKLLGIVLIMALVMSMGIMAWADGETGGEGGTTTPTASTETVTITVGRDSTYAGVATEAGRTFTWYKIFSATYGSSFTADNATGYEDDGSASFNAGTATGVSYLATAAVKAILDDAENVWFTTTAIPGDAAHYVVSWNSATTQNVDNLQEAAAWLIENGAYEDTGSLDFANAAWSAEVEKGYYVIASDVGANLIAATTDVDISEKNSYPPLTKEQADEDDTTMSTDERSVAIGDVLDYEVTVTIPLTAKVGDTIEVYDKATNGLTFNDDVVVTFDDTEVEPAADTQLSEGTVATGEAWHYVITVTDSNKGAVVKFAFSMTVNDDALVDTGRENEADLKYGNEYEAIPKTVKYTTYYTGIIKVDGSDTTTPLEGVKFTLKEGDAEFKVSKPTGEDYYIPDANGSSEVVTDANGKIIIRGLDNDKTYTLTETETNDGYNLLDAPKTLTLIEDTFDETSGDPTYDATTEFDKVLNNKGTVLPSTGGIGTTIFYVVGSILVVAAGVLLITKKRMSREG